MALLTCIYNPDDFPNFIAMAKGLEVVSAQALGYVGNEAKKILKYSLLSGQMLDYQKGKGRDRWTDKIGRHKASYRITRQAKYVIIASYPANFFTVSNPRQLDRDIWGGLKTATNARLDSILKEFDRKYLEKEMQKLDATVNTRKRF